MKHTLPIAVLSTALFTGCGADPQVVSDTELLTTFDLNVQDVERFAEELASNLITADILGQNGQPSIIVVESFKNESTQGGLDRDRILGSVLTTLNRSNVAKAYLGGTSLGPGESALATQEADQRGVFERGVLDRPYQYAVLTTLYEDRTTLNRQRQTSYILQMVLVDLDTQLEAWRDQRRITKQGTRPAIGG